MVLGCQVLAFSGFGVHFFFVLGLGSGFCVFWGLGFGFWVFGFRVWVLGGFRVLCFGFCVLTV